ncbi:MAG: serine hydrolase [Aureispira sp.]|nr:serine hydrolase [Aureispira sp.]
MTRSFYTLFSTICISYILLTSCALGRVSVHFLPNVTDHKKVFKCDTVTGCTYAAKAFEEAKNYELPPVEKWVSPAFLGESKNLDEFFEKSKTTAFVVVRNDSILYERYMKDQSKEDQRVVFSITKSFVATLAHIAASEGYLDLNQPVADFIPEFGEDARKDIRISHLLNMTSGLDWMDHKNVIKLGKLYYTANQYKFIARYDKLAHEPGTHFSYKSISTQILGLCLEKATGQKLSAYLHDKIWDPLEMEYNALFTVDSKKNKNNRFFGGLAVTGRDLLRFGKLLLHKGEWRGQQLLPKSFIEHLYSRKNRMEGSWWGYASCFWRNGYLLDDHLEDTDFYAAGYGGQFLYVNPKHNLLILRMGTAETGRWSLNLGRLANLIGKGENDLTAKKYNFYDQFEGVYKMEDGKTFQLEYLGPVGDHGRKRWVWRRDLLSTSRTKRIDEVYQFDGRSAGHKKGSHRMLLMFDIKDGKVEGLYYDDCTSVEPKYLKKTSQVPLVENNDLSHRK